MKSRLLFPVAILISILCISWTVLRSKKKSKNYEVTGTIRISHDYCNGAAPSFDQLNKSTYPVAGTTLYVCRQIAGGKRSKYFDSIVCDTAGKFSIKLQAGKYALVQKWRTEPLVVPPNTQFETWDTACYREDYNKSDYLLDVKGKTSDVNITLRRYCSWTRPCCTFKGPFPPSAPPTNRGGNQPGHQEQP